MVGAILTQATNWNNVERAIGRLRRERALTATGLRRVRTERLARLIRPAGYPGEKATRLAAFTRWYLRRGGGRAARLFRTPWPALRRELLRLRGIGPETADAILLYAGAQPVFVVDAYTRRVFARHGLNAPAARYEDIQHQVMAALPGGAERYNELHALLVVVGKRHCHRRRPACAGCPLEQLPHNVC